MKRITTLMISLAVFCSGYGQTVISSELGGGLTDLTPSGVNVTNTDAEGGGYGKVIAAAGDKLIFAGSDETNGEELWVTDGTVAGTSMLMDIYQGAMGSAPNLMCTVGDKVYFTASTSNEGNELWVTDGTATGTQMVKDIYTGFNQDTGEPFGAAPDMLTAYNGKLLFRALDFFSDDPENPEKHLWITDGTAQGTEKLFKIQASNSGNAEGHERYKYIQVSGDKAFFLGQSAVYGEELWVTDGTAEGTHMVLDIVYEADTTNAACDSCTASNSIAWLFSINDEQVIFQSQTPTIWHNDTSSYVNYGGEPWISDGTPEGTYPLGEVRTTEDSEDPTETKSCGAGYWCLYNNEIYFRATNDLLNNELHSTTNEPNVAEVVYNACGSKNGKEGTGYLNNLEVFDGILWKANSNNKPDGGIRLPDGNYPQRELFGYDAVRDTVILCDINPGTSKSKPLCIRRSNGRLYFSATDTESQKVFCLRPAAEDATYTPLPLFDEDGDAQYHSLRSVNGKLYFISQVITVDGETSTTSQKLYIYDDGRSVQDNSEAMEAGPAPADYKNRMVNLYGCDAAADDSYIVNIDTCNADESSIEDELANSTALYPNPAVDEITFKLNGQYEANILIYSASGRAVWSGTVVDSETVNISDFEAGIYAVHICTPQGNVSSKLIITQ